ncbi:MAG: tetratricopeptide repeat protein [Chromatiaceae bacterium]|jgi:tetratricopeptide (TPR) repeat protein|nr:tetratricopeptide repeat protein [Chromatiaceae bacterium]
MPRLSPLHWIILIVFLGFYGFAVFALTRDYYQRNASQRPAVQAQSGQPAPRTWIQDEMQGAPGSLTPLTETDIAALGRQADTLFGMRRYGEAIPYYRRILELDAANADAKNDLGLALHYIGQGATAMQVLAQGAEGAPDFQRIWLTLGFVRAQNGDFAGARAALERAQALGADSEIGTEATRLLGALKDK